MKLFLTLFIATIITFSANAFAIGADPCGFFRGGPEFNFETKETVLAVRQQESPEEKTVFFDQTVQPELISLATVGACGAQELLNIEGKQAAQALSALKALAQNIFLE